jgi:hypothetical protein
MGRIDNVECGLRIGELRIPERQGRMSDGKRIEKRE